MSDKNFTTRGDESLEARIVAWVLGEASAFEAEELERLCDEKPEFAVFRRRIEAVHGLCGEAHRPRSGADAAWKLSPERRAAIKALVPAADGMHPGATDPGKVSALRDAAREQRVQRSGRQAMMAVAACLVLTLVVATLSWPLIMGSGSFSIDKARSLKQEEASIVRYSYELEESAASGGSVDGSDVILGKRARNMIPLSQVAGPLPDELIEGTPKPMQVPGLVDPSARPEMRRMAEVQDRKSESRFADKGVRERGLAAPMVSAERFENLKSDPFTAAPAEQAVESEVDLVDVIDDSLSLREANDNASKRPASPAASMANTIPSSGVDSNAVPVPVGGAQAAPSPDFGEGDSYGTDRGSGADLAGMNADFSSLAAKENLQRGRKDQLARATNTEHFYRGEPMSEVTDAAEAGASESFYRSGLLDNDHNDSGLTRIRQIEDQLNALDKRLGDSTVSDSNKQEVYKKRQMLLQEGIALHRDLEATQKSGERSEQAPELNSQPSERMRILEEATEIGSSDDSLKAGRAAEILAGITPSTEAELEKAIREQEDKVEERRKVLSTMARTKGIIYRGDDSFSNGADTGDELNVNKTPSTYYQLEQEKLQLESQIGSLLKYDSDQQMVYASGLNLPDNVVMKLYPQYLEQKRKIDGLKINGLADDHPTVRDAEKTLGEMKKQMDESVVNLRATLQAQLELATDRLEKVEGMKDLTREEAIKRGLDAQDYVDAKNAFETDNALLELLKLKQSELKAKEMPEAKRPLVTEEETVAAEEPYSTFSLNISDASFRIAQAALAKGEMPDPTAIKAEQFYNAVDYGDPAPAAGMPVASHIEQVAHPLIPGRQLVRIAVKTASEGRNQGQPLRLTLLVDQSGSMAREDRRQAMVDALKGLQGLLTERDQVHVIGFARTPRLLAEALPGNQGAQLPDLIHIEANEGGTNLEEAIKLGEQLAERHQLKGAQNRMVLFTDGAANLGDADPDSLAEKIKELRQKGIAFDIAGIAADGLNDELLGELARHGNGRYSVVGKGGDARFAEQLAGAFRPAAENVKVQVHFNPERVGRYKLIGFEKDRLNKEDFRNDAVDAAELAAEEAGVAIYQVETLPEGQGEIGEVSVRFRDVASGRMVERSWTISHDPSAPALDRAQPSMQLATLAMLAAEKLRGGPLADAIQFSEMAEVQARITHHFRGDQRVAGMMQMIDQLK